jgi:hypothetical protein
MCAGVFQDFFIVFLVVELGILIIVRRRRSGAKRIPHFGSTVVVNVVLFLVIVRGDCDRGFVVLETLVLILESLQETRVGVSLEDGVLLWW